MNEQVARNVTLVRAIESADTARELLSEDDRMYASRSAKELAQWQAADSASEPTAEHFLQQRSDQLIKRLSERHGAFAAFYKRMNGTRLLPLLPPAALLLGFLLDRIGDPHRVDLLSAPLLAILAWNVLVYAIMLVWLFIPRRTGWAGESLVRRLALGAASLPRKLPKTLASGLADFAAAWTTASQPLIRARLARTMHLAAAMFALGAIASLYVRGLMTQYAAGWESTFLTAGQLHSVLAWLFTPATVVFGLPGFTESQIAALHFAQSTPGAGEGRLWVHLYAGTLALFVVVPRLLMAGVAHLRAARLERRFPIDLDLPYYRQFAQQAGLAEPGVMRVLPYSFTVDEDRDRGLAALAVHMLGERSRMILRPASAYGEDPAAALRGVDLADTSVTMTAILFALAATPEREAHGAFIDFLARSRVRGLRVLVDESAFLERIGTQRGSEQRIAERVHLWRQFCDYHGVPATLVNLQHPEKYPVQ
ncbi:DUF2868 domain-containing protein [Pseudoduganella sp. GCM10020061]|uniref:DUF2868 domain-containing protein n=1 Tax=Pseudoduganella sp. GCM10020061 TaxID=3317345 RepID=UPI00363DC9BD